MTIGKLTAAACLLFAMAATAVTPLGLASAQETTPPQAAADGLTIVVEHVPADTPKDASIYVAGTFNGYQTNLPEYRLTPDGHGRYTITLPGSIRGPVKFSFTLGSRATAELDAAGGKTARRTFTVPQTGAATYTGSIAAWPPIHTPEAWRKAAASDLTAMHDMLRDNAPQMFVERDSALFRKWLETGYAEAQRLLPKVRDYNGYLYLLKGYAGGFRDPHLTVSGNPEIQRWPGFATRWLDGAYVVSMTSASATDRLPPVGAKLLDCDGKSAEELARARLDRYYGNLDLDFLREAFASLLLMELPNPFVEPLKTCRFQEASAIRTYPLSYRPGERNERIITNLPRARFGLEHPAPKVWRIGLPTTAGEPDWPRLYADIEAHADEIRNSDRVIIDLRGNTGGNGQFADRLAKGLWGEAVFGHYRPFPGRVLFPAVKAMRQYTADTVIPDKRKLIQAGKLPESAIAGDELLLVQLDTAIAEGRKTIILGLQSGLDRGAPPANPMKAQVFLVTDHACNSACLYLMDFFLAIPNVYHAGTRTGADTIFNERETHQLPSGLAILSYGHKALIDRPRGSNVPYTPAPALTYRGDLADEAAFERWLAALPAQTPH